MSGAGWLMFTSICRGISMFGRLGCCWAGRLTLAWPGLLLPANRAVHRRTGKGHHDSHDKDDDKSDHHPRGSPALAVLVDLVFDDVLCH
jgi:hypothetical protein